MLELGNNWLSLDGACVLGDDRVREQGSNENNIKNNEDHFRIKANYKKSRCQHWVALMFQPLTLFQVRNKWPWDFGWIGSYLCFINWVDQLCILHHQNLARNGRDKATIVILWIYSSFLFNLTMGYKYLYHY